MFVDAKSLFRVNRVERAGCAKGGYLQTLTLTLRRTCRARCTCLWTVDLGHPKCAAEPSPRGASMRAARRNSFGSLGRETQSGAGRRPRFALSRENPQGVGGTGRPIEDATARTPCLGRRDGRTRIERRPPFFLPSARAGANSQGGERTIERLLSVDQTCRLQRRSLYAYLADALISKARGDPVSTLT